MKIIYDHQIFCRQVFGGVSRYFTEISTQIARLGNEVEIRSPFYVTKYFKNGALKPQGIRLPKIPYTARLFSATNDCLAKLIWSTNDCADIIHRTYFNQEGCSYRKSCSCVKIVTAFDMIHELLPEEFKKNDKTAEKKRKCFENSDHIICISKNTRKDLLDIYNLPSSKVSVVPLGFTRREGYEITRQLRTPYILFVGNRFGYKNFQRFISAFANSKRLMNNFNIICFGGEKAKSSGWNYISKSKTGREKIAYVRGDDKLLASLYSNAMALVYPSLYEGFGLPLLEAMSYGCPVICSNTSSMPEVAGRAAEFFDPYSIDSIRTSIEKVVFDEAYRRDMIDNGLKQLKKFSWGKCAIDTLEVYKKVLAEK